MSRHIASSAVVLTIACVAAACGNDEPVAPVDSAGGQGGTPAEASTGGASTAGANTAGASTGGATASDLPSSADLSQSEHFPPIFDQGAVGTCDWSAAVYYQMTYATNRARNRECDESNTFSPKFGYNILNNAGAFPFNIRLPDVYEFVAHHGAATLTQVPYDMANGSGYREWCTDGDIWEAALSYRIASYEYFEYHHSRQTPQTIPDFGDYVHEVKQRLSEGEVLVFQTNPDPGLVAVGTVGNDPATSEDDAFVDESIITEGIDGYDHTMALVGYDDHLWTDLNGDGLVQAEEKGAYKIADSFGENVPAHNDGFLWLAYSTFGDSIYLNRFYRMTGRESYTPRIVARITLNHGERDELKFQFGRSTSRDTSRLDPEAVFDPYGMGYETGEAGVSLIEGGHLAFDGGTEAMDGSFAFDLTDLDEANDGSYYYLRISNSGNSPLVIKDFRIVDLTTGVATEDEDLPVTITDDEVYRFVEVE